MPPPRIWATTGRIAYDLVRTTGGAAYLPRRLVDRACRQAVWIFVAAAPRIARTIFAAYPIWSERETLVGQGLDAAKSCF